MTTPILTRKGQPVETPPFISILFKDKRATNKVANMQADWL